MMTNHRLYYLLDRYYLKQHTEEEKQELFGALAGDTNENLVKEWMKNVIETAPELEMDTATTNELLSTILQVKSAGSGQQPRPAEARPPSASRRLVGTPWFRYAAAAIVVAGLGVYLWSIKSPQKEIATNEATLQIDDVPPGGNRALLTLADGQTIMLDSAADGSLALQGGTRIIKLANGEIAYVTAGADKGEVLWNTMSTPVGGQYQLRLADGTKVWLNAASSITYPTAFVGSERSVKIKGEVYFEVEKDVRQPFVVDIYGGSRVQVLGTSFNVNSYENEAGSKTTLLDGSIRLLTADTGVILKPGQQAEVLYAINAAEHAGNVKVTSDIDMEHALAWKNGLFNFDGLDLKAAMRQVERWYHVEVQYSRAAPMNNEKFGGKVYRSSNLSDVLEILEKVGDVKFKLEGNKLIVQ